MLRVVDSDVTRSTKLAGQNQTKGHDWPLTRIIPDERNLNRDTAEPTYKFGLEKRSNTYRTGSRQMRKKKTKNPLPSISVPTLVAT